jgi:4-amino-4-deoxy-L-arabinose transferase-like glycosyltransferase
LDLHGAASPDRGGMRGTDARAAWGLSAILVGTFLIRLVRLDQPIVENYVGRQVPTAMVARNLERGSGFFHPQLDTAPFPNYFPVEPPVYQLLVVGLRRLSGCPLEVAGRIVTAAATSLGAWGLFGLVRRREGERLALASAVAFSLLPVTLRYGRAFQPDAMMLGGVLCGLDFWDRGEERGGGPWLLAAWASLAIGFACKITAAAVLVPLALAIMRPAKTWKLVLGGTTMLPVLAWYAWAGHLVASAASRAAEGNRDIWLSVLGLSSLVAPETLGHLWRFLVVRAFTPPGLVLAAWGLISTAPGLGRPTLWRAWGLAVLASLALLAGKLHHEYYWLGLAPVVAVGIARGLEILDLRSRALARGSVLLLLASGAFLSRSTWQTPAEWAGLEQAARDVQALVPPGDLLVAPEPLLFEADRRGCRLEFTAPAAARATSEWPAWDVAGIDSPLALIEFYRLRGARYVADVAPRGGDERRKALHESIRRRYKVKVDRESVLIAELVPSETPGNAQ